MKYKLGVAKEGKINTCEYTMKFTDAQQFFFFLLQF